MLRATTPSTPTSPAGTGPRGTPWIEEVENYVRGWALKSCKHVLSFRRTGGTLVAVAAFDEFVVRLPIIRPVPRPCWWLRVVAVELEYQRKGLSEEVFAGTFEAMRQLGPDRALVVARVHREHRASLTACRKVGLLQLRRNDDHYLELLGEVPPH